MTTKGKEVDHNLWVWGSVPRALRARGSPAIIIVYRVNLNKLSRSFVVTLRTTTTNHRVSFIDLYSLFSRNFRIVFLPHTNTVILPPGVVGIPHMKVVGMLVFSLRGVSFGFWSHLLCSGQNAIIFTREGLV